MRRKWEIDLLYYSLASSAMETRPPRLIGSSSKFLFFKKKTRSDNNACGHDDDIIACRFVLVLYSSPLSLLRSHSLSPMHSHVDGDTELELPVCRIPLSLSVSVTR